MGAEFWADAGYFADGSSIVKVGNALFEGHEQGADPHREGSALPTSKYIADVGYFADGTSMVKCGNALFEGHDQGSDPHTNGSALPVSKYLNVGGLFRQCWFRCTEAPVRCPPVFLPLACMALIPSTASAHLKLLKPLACVLTFS